MTGLLEAAWKEAVAAARSLSKELMVELLPTPPLPAQVVVRVRVWVWVGEGVREPWRA